MSVSYNSINKKLSISEMAQIHNITRQTLIYYDKIDLFKPEITESNGYRFYTTMQIPKLSEICFLRSIGMPLDDIRKNNAYNNSQSTIQLLESQEEKLKKQIAELTYQLEKIDQRVSIYKNATEYDADEYKPTIKEFPERHVFYHAWDPDDLTRHGLHFALMRSWNETAKFGLLPTNRYGSLFFKESIENGTPLVGAGTVCLLDSDLPFRKEDELVDGVKTLKAGTYVCMQKFGMPYGLCHMKKLLHWIDSNGYEVAGDIFDECLMDASFYEDSNLEQDFCELQVPIRPKQ